jgi:diguanylate cyclase (GGDEF)-like protein
MTGHRTPHSSFSDRGPRDADEAVAQAIQNLADVLSSSSEVSEDARAALETLRGAWVSAQRGAGTDVLTDLPNRAQFERALGTAMRDTNRVVLMFLDLDGFKTVNDQMGHRAGDLLLRAVARRVQSSVRDGDLVARHGGDEFVVLLREPAAAELAPLLAQRIVENVSTAYSLEGTTFQLSVSVGVAVYPDHARDADTLLERADVAMYRAKRRGGGGHAIYEESFERHHESGVLSLGHERNQSSGS